MPNNPVDFKSLDETASNILMALTTDGAHHKQHYLEEALRALAGDNFYEAAKAEFQWYEGIAP